MFSVILEQVHALTSIAAHWLGPAISQLCDSKQMCVTSQPQLHFTEKWGQSDLFQGCWEDETRKQKTQKMPGTQQLLDKAQFPFSQAFHLILLLFFSFLLSHKSLKTQFSRLFSREIPGGSRIGTCLSFNSPYCMAQGPIFLLSWEQLLCQLELSITLSHYFPFYFLPLRILFLFLKSLSRYLKGYLYLFIENFCVFLKEVFQAF